MGRIDFRSGKYRARIFTKGHDITHTFADKKTAELWIAYKEDLINQIEAFNPKSTDLVEFGDAIDLKISEALKDGLVDRSITDLKELHNVFASFKGRMISDITYEDFMKFCKDYLSTPVVRGGFKANGSGRSTMPTKQTLLSKLRRLSGVYSNLINNGIPVENIPVKIGAWLNGQEESI